MPILIQKELVETFDYKKFLEKLLQEITYKNGKQVNIVFKMDP